MFMTNTTLWLRTQRTTSVSRDTDPSLYTTPSYHLTLGPNQGLTGAIANLQNVILVIRFGCHGSLHHCKHPLSYFSFQPVLHDWCNKGCGMCYPVYGMVHIKEPLLLIGKSSLCGGSRFPFSLSEWSLTICLTPYNRR